MRHDDHVKRAWVKSLYHLDVRDACRFAVVLDVSRFSADRLVEIMLAAGGIATAEAAVAS